MLTMRILKLIREISFHYKIKTPLHSEHPHFIILLLIQNNRVGYTLFDREVSRQKRQHRVVRTYKHLHPLSISSPYENLN